METSARILEGFASEGGIENERERGGEREREGGRERERGREGGRERTLTRKL